MAPRLRLNNGIAAVIGCLFLAGCALRMPIPRDLAAKAEEMPVRRKHSLLTDRVHWVRFGPYRVEQIRKRRNPAEWDGRLGLATLNSEAFYDYVVEYPEGSWKCACRNSAERRDYFPTLGPIREVGYRISLECGIMPGKGGAMWRLTLVEEDSSGGVLHGKLGKDGEEGTISVVGTHAYRDKKGRSPSHTGFQFEDDAGGAVGALELIGRQKVLMGENTQMELRPALAAVSAALLLYDDLNERIRDEVQNKLVYGIQVFSAVQRGE
jgi:hypothetical protein